MSISKLLVLFIFIPALANGSTTCESLKSDCEYYSCMEANKKCGDTGYLKNFGHRYCLRFDDKKHRFSEKGKLWLSRVKSCLIDEIVKLPDTTSCSNLKSAAFAQHVPCYLKTGFCSLSRLDKIRLYKTVLKDIWRYEIFSTGIEVRLSCLRNYIN